MTALVYPTADQLRTHGRGQHGAPADRLASYIDPLPNGCWRWEGSTTSSGYGHFSINGVYYQAHRLMYILRRGPVTAATLDHLCRNRWCVNPWHLEPVSAQENTRRGKTAKVTPEQVQAIRAAVRAGGGIRQVARLFGVDHSLVSRVMTGKRWSDVPERAEEEAA